MQGLYRFLDRIQYLVLEDHWSIFGGGLQHCEVQGFKGCDWAAWSSPVVIYYTLSELAAALTILSMLYRFSFIVGWIVPYSTRTAFYFIKPRKFVGRD
jgi:hypothetical protein